MSDRQLQEWAKSAQLNLQKMHWALMLANPGIAAWTAPVLFGVARFEEEEE